MARKVKLFALSTCGWCKKTHFFLQDNGIEHEVIPVDLLDEKEKEQVRNELGRYNPRKSYPTVVIDDKVAVVGYEEEKLRLALGLQPEESPAELMKHLAKEAEASGYFLNPDEGHVLTLMEGLLKNTRRFGYLACPCMESTGTRLKDLDIICPCDYRDQDIEEYGTCYCGLYVSREVAEGKQPVTSIPLRRPAEESRAVAAKPQGPSGASGLSLPVWRCRVCGYLCAKEGPPQKCPICGADKDRFEVFINYEK